MELSEAARQSHGIGLHALHPSITHIPYPIIVQTKKLGHVRRIDTSIGRKANTLKHKAFHAAGKTRLGAVLAISFVKPPDMRLGSVKSQMRVGYGPEDIFLVAITLFFVSMMLSC